MVRPDYKEFSRLAREATLIPVTKLVTADLQTPVSAFLAFAGDDPYARRQKRDQDNPELHRMERSIFR